MSIDMNSIIACLHKGLVRLCSNKGWESPGEDWSHRSARDLGLDSLDLAELFLELELELGFEVSSADLIEHHSFNELATELAKRSS